MLERRLPDRQNIFLMLPISPNSATAIRVALINTVSKQGQIEQTHYEKVREKRDGEERCDEDHIDWQVLGGQKVSPGPPGIIAVIDVDHLHGMGLRNFKNSFDQE